LESNGFALTVIFFVQDDFFFICGREGDVLVFFFFLTSEVLGPLLPKAVGLFGFDELIEWVSDVSFTKIR
jgi:hypothetical protein